MEAILLELPSRDLLVGVQRVNRAWHNTIKSSPVFQRLLFFQPWPPSQRQEPKANDLLSEAFPPFFSQTVNKNHYGKWPAEILSELDWNSSPRKIEAYSRKEASWRQMLVVQPPLKRLVIVKTSSSMAQDGKTEGKLVTHRGLRMGTLYDFVQEEVNSESTYQSTRFDLQWHMLSPTEKQSTTSTLATPGKYVPPHARKSRQGLTLQLCQGFSCCERKRHDFVPPEHLKGKDFKDFDMADRLLWMMAESTNERPHLRSKAYIPVGIEWGETQILRGR